MTEDETKYTFKENAFIASCMAGGIGFGAAGVGLVLGGIGLAAAGPIAGGIFAGA